VRRATPTTRLGRAFIGTSGYDYPRWKGDFYPRELPRRRWLEHIASLLNALELNGTFYSLKNPDVFRRWAAETPPGFVFAVKGSRFITHNLKLRRAEGALANFYASGVLALGRKTGPFLWQLPDSYAFDTERVEAFLRLLPRTSRDAAELARRHDHRLRRGALTEASVAVRYRHALEVRHPSYFRPEFYDLLRRHRAGFVIADTAGKWSYAEEVTAPFVYVRLHGSRQLYVSGYTDEELDTWADRIRDWTAAGHDVHVYFDNDARGHAPHDAVALAERVRDRLARVTRPRVVQS
jgi:uncharacterized protein YecE (DUF72 family)